MMKASRSNWRAGIVLSSYWSWVHLSASSFVLWQSILDLCVISLNLSLTCSPVQIRCFTNQLMAFSTDVQGSSSSSSATNPGTSPVNSTAMHMNIYSLCSPVVRASALEGHVRICLAQYALLAEMQKKNSADSTHKAGTKDVWKETKTLRWKKEFFFCETYFIHIIFPDPFQTYFSQ